MPSNRNEIARLAATLQEVLAQALSSSNRMEGSPRSGALMRQPEPTPVPAPSRAPTPPFGGGTANYGFGGFGQNASKPAGGLFGQIATESTSGFGGVGRQSARKPSDGLFGHLASRPNSSLFGQPDSSLETIIGL
ncbi:MAG: hypothetical protein M1830_001221 [Pleopsidium flavum]|nr:MAG: hypothetical protein M1830_001221 [Pleopsidium flavum]